MTERPDGNFNSHNDKNKDSDPHTNEEDAVFESDKELSDDEIESINQNVLDGEKESGLSRALGDSEKPADKEEIPDEREDSPEDDNETLAMPSYPSLKAIEDNDDNSFSAVDNGENNEPPLPPLSAVKENSAKKEDPVSSDAPMKRRDRHRKKKKNGLPVLIGILIVVIIGFVAFLVVTTPWDDEEQEEEIVETEEEIDTRISVPRAQGAISVEETEEEICSVFTESGLDCSFSEEPHAEIPRGNIVSQIPEAGEFVEEDEETIVELVYSRGPETSDFPELNNESIEYAEETLWGLGIEVEDIEYISSSGLIEDRVVEASVEVGESVSNGDSVILYISDGTVEIPNWVGETRETVETESDEIGVDVSFNTEESDEETGTVLSQSDSGEVHINDVVEVTTAVPFESVEIEIPDVLGMDEEDAQYELAEAGFRNIATLEVTTNEVDEPVVTQVSPSVGSSGMSEERVVIVVSIPTEDNGD